MPFSRGRVHASEAQPKPSPASVHSAHKRGASDQVGLNRGFLLSQAVLLPSAKGAALLARGPGSFFCLHWTD